MKSVDKEVIYNHADGEDLSGILCKGINDNPNMKPIKSSRISTKDVQFGTLTNGVTGVSKAIMRLKKLEQFFIANSPVRSEGLFIDVSPDSPYYEERDEWKWEDMTTLTDIEIYNCPYLEKLPTDMLKSFHLMWRIIQVFPMSS